MTVKPNLWVVLYHRRDGTYSHFTLHDSKECADEIAETEYARFTAAEIVEYAPVEKEEGK